MKLGENKLLSVETNISNWQRKQNSNNNFSATVPYDMERQREESREFLNDLVARDQRMIPALITLVHTADTKEQLDADTESIRQCARKHLCSLNILRWQQLEGLNTVLPYGAPKLGIRRTLTTESLAVFMPFRVQEVCHTGGIYFANNAISKNLIMVNRAELLNGNSFITGVSGSGKSILAKQEIIKLRTCGHAQSGGDRPRRAGKSDGNFGFADGVYHECRCRTRACCHKYFVLKVRRKYGIINCLNEEGGNLYGNIQ